MYPNDFIDKNEVKTACKIYVHENSTMTRTCICFKMEKKILFQLEQNVLRDNSQREI